VSKDAAYTLLSPADLREYTGLSTSTILQKQKLVINVGWETVRWHLNGMYGGIIEGLDAEGVLTFRVMETVDIKQVAINQMSLEWVGSMANDMIADSVLALLLGIDQSPASIKLSAPHHHSHTHESQSHPDEHKHDIKGGSTNLVEEGSSDAHSLMARIDRLIGFLSVYFGDVKLLEADGDHPCPRAQVHLDEVCAEISLDEFTVESESESFKARVSSVVDMAVEVVAPLNEIFPAAAGHHHPAPASTKNEKNVICSS